MFLSISVIFFFFCFLHTHILQNSLENITTIANESHIMSLHYEKIKMPTLVSNKMKIAGAEMRWQQQTKFGIIKFFRNLIKQHY